MCSIHCQTQAVFTYTSHLIELLVTDETNGFLQGPGNDSLVLVRVHPSEGPTMRSNIIPQQPERFISAGN